MDHGAKKYLHLPQNKCLHQLFEWMVDRQPNAPALMVGEKTWTYQQIDQKANQLAHFLVERSIQKEDLIAICVERSAEMVIGILGILKAGAAYLPIDPLTPPDRMALLLEESKSPILLTQKKLDVTTSSLATDRALIDLGSGFFDVLPTTSVEVDCHPQQLAYTIFTSGSTGQPKGVQIEHQSVANLVQGQLAFVEKPVGRFLFAYSFAFDGSVLLLFWTLLSGGTLVMAPEDLEKDIHQLAHFIQQYRITHLLTFASLYGLLLERASASQLTSLQHVSVAGEVCPPALVGRHHHQLPGVVLLNQYGPTEATVGATIYRTSPDDATKARIPIGKSINKVQVYVLDDEGQPCHPGQTGEGYIAGAGVARGYLNRPELTRQRFVTNPFAPSGKMYRTGDLAVLLPDGNIDFIGRADFQIKLRGYRIEPGEIEHTLTQYPHIREAVVLRKGSTPAEQKLVAYIVANENSEVNQTDLRQSLSAQLPAYMIPAVFVVLEKMPLTTIGKIDRGALPDPDQQRPVLAQAYAPPRTLLEKKLTSLWQQILKIDKIGIHDRFFELGGNSLQAADFTSQLQSELGEVVFVTSIFDQPTIAAFAQMLEKDYVRGVENYLQASRDAAEEMPLPSLVQNSAKQSIDDDPPKKAKLPATAFQKFDEYFPKTKLKPTTEEPKLQQAVFILAPPRSGTSLLRIMLAGHPRLYASNELQLLHFNTLAERQTAYCGRFSLWSEGLLRLIMSLKNCSADEAKEFVQQYIDNDATTRQMYAQLQSWMNDRHLVDKSPSYALDPAALQKAEAEFDQPLYINLVRHPYAMIRSFEKMHMDKVMFLHPHPYDARHLGELIWTKSHQIITTFLQNVPAHRQFYLKYEYLVQQPDIAMRQLCDRFGWDFVREMTQPYQNLDQKMVDGLYEESKPMGDINLLTHKKIDPALAEAWRGVLKDNFLSHTTWSTAASLGYTPPDGSFDNGPDPGHEKEKKKKPHTGETKPPPIHSATSRDIAIIGMTGRFPGAANIDQFWENLKNETDVSKTFTPDDLKKEGQNPALLHDPNFVNRGMPLADADHFAAEFFGYLPNEAALMDPQHRHFLECAYTALEHAGYHSGNSDQRIGVYGAVARNTYLVNNVITHPRFFRSVDDFQLGITLEKDFPATRVAYQLDLRGPALNVQTACSSSGVALHLACENILLGESDIILVGGGRIQPPLYVGHMHKEGHALSPDGYVRAFDAEANGMVRGHGMAFIVIKKLEQALADGDTIHAVIKGSAIGNDGSGKVGFTAPGVEGQSQTIVQAYKNAGINPESVSYVEAHGTGTRLGDPVEVAALTKAFRHFTNKKGFCGIGSVKTNIGHLDAGACMAGIIKTVLAMKHERLPASLHFKTPNPQIPFDESPFFVTGTARDWKRTAQPRRAGVSSFGLGGTNVHIVLEEAPGRVRPDVEEKAQLLILSAKTPTALDALTAQMGAFLQQHTDLRLTDLAATLQLGRKAYAHRRILAAHSVEEAALAFRQKDPQKVITTHLQNPVGKTVFLFPGGGAQHTNMGLGLYQTETVFRNAVDRCLTILQQQHQLHLRSILYPDHSKSEPITDPLHGITLLFTIEYATAQLWMSKDIHPDEMIGHSLGEYVAACLAGVFSLEDALALVAKRGRLFLQLEEGGMLSIPLSEKEVTAYLEDDLSLAAINKPDYCVVSGPVGAINRIKEKLTQQEIHATRLHINVAAHSQMVEAILDEFGAFLEQVTYSPPTLPIVSNLDGNYVGPETMQTPDYWKKHLRQTVRFADGMTTLLTDEQKLLIEIGPGQTLSTFTRQHPQRREHHQVVASLRHPKETTPDRLFWLKSLGQVWLVGVEPNWKQNFQQIRRIPLPTYPFERKRYWIEPKAFEAQQYAPERDHIIQNISMPIENQPAMPSDHRPKLIRKQLLVGKLKTIFHELSGLPVDSMADHATFLELGFDSLFLTQSLTRIKKSFGVKINFRQLFDEAPTTDALAGYIDSQLPETALQEELQNENRKHIVEHPGNDIAQTPSDAISFEPTALPPSSPIQPSTRLEVLIEQQLRLMQQQLELLRGGTQQSPGQLTPPLSQRSVEQPVENASGQVTPWEKPPAPPQPEDLEAVAQQQNFGPWQPIRKKTLADLTDREKKYLDDLIRRYTTRTKGSQALAQAQRRHMADPRSIVGFNRMWKDMVYQIAMTHSKGAKMWDVDGNEYIDFRSSFGINLFGHTPDFVQQAIKEQVDKGFELGVLTPLAKEVCDLICELTGTERASLVNTGSEAVSACVRAARTATGKDKIVVFEGDYHGIADEMLVRGIDRGDQRISMPIAPGIPPSLVEQVIVLDYDDPNVLNKIHTYAGELAAVIIEPIQPNLPTRQPVELLKAIRQLTLEEDIALVFDEMITGFRLGVQGAQGWYGVEADIIAYGKILSGGLPMAAVAGKARFLDVFDGGQWAYGDDSIPEAGVTFFGGTFCKHPVSLAASLATLREIKRRGQPMYDDLNARSARFAERLKQLFETTKVPLQVLSTASIVAIKIMNKNPLSALFFYYLRLKGIHIKEKAALLSVAHTEEELDFTYRMFEESIREMQTAGFWPISAGNVAVESQVIPVPSSSRQVQQAEEGKEGVPLTDGQKEVWVEQQLGDEAAAAYNLAGDLHLHGSLDITVLEKAIRALIQRHEALRTVFDPTEPVQKIFSEVAVELPIIDLAEERTEERLRQLEELRAEETTRPLDLFKGPLIRFKLIKLGKTDHHLFITAHHGIADGWSCGLLVRDLGWLYTRISRNQTIDLQPPKQLSDFAREQNAFKQTQEYREAEEYWLSQFKDEVPVLEFPTDRSRPPVKTYVADFARATVDRTLLDQLKVMSSRHGATLFISLYAAFQAFVYRLSRQEDFVLGVVAAAQGIAGNEDLVAHGVSLLPVRAGVDGSKPFADHMRVCRNSILDAFEHQQYTLGSLVRKMNLPRDPGRQPIISILFNMDSDFGRLEFGDLEADLQPIPRNFETFDIFFNVKITESGIDLEWTFNTDLFDKATIERRLAEFTVLLQSIVQNTTSSIDELDLLPVWEREQLLLTWNQTDALFPDQVCTHELFEKQAAATPNRIAVESQDISLTYQQLNESANRIGHYLLQQGVQTGDFVAIYMERSVDLLVGLMGILKAGGIYVPLDPANPKERLKVIVEDAEARVLLTKENMLGRLPEFSGKVIVLEKESDRLQQCSYENVGAPVSSTDLAYVIYTSGSTGRPKGVIIPHYALVDHHLAMIRAIGVSDEEVILSVASVSFDPSVQDFFMPLFVGAKVVIASQEEVMDGHLLKNRLAKSNITLMQATPATWLMLIASGWLRQRTGLR